MKPIQEDNPGVLPGWNQVFQDQGIKILGVASPDPEANEQERYHKWISQGRHGQMNYLATHETLKFRPEGLLPGCKSIIFTALGYYQELNPGDLSTHRGRFARYAWGRDYHKTLGNRLKKIVSLLREACPEEGFRSFTDSGPLAERWYAQQAGLGFIGRHTLLIDPQLGSWFILGEILTTLDPEIWVSAMKEPTREHHGLKKDLSNLNSHTRGACPSGCQRCIQVCPTGALEGNGLMDGRKCISYLTIEHKGSIPLDLRPKMGNWIFGCDLCQEVCPFNLRTGITQEEDFIKPKAGSSRELREILEMSPEDFFTTFAGSPVMRTGYSSLLRNACNASGNSKDPSLANSLKLLAQGEDTVVREHALWALEQLGRPHG